MTALLGDRNYSPSRRRADSCGSLCGSLAGSLSRSSSCSSLASAADDEEPERALATRLPLRRARLRHRAAAAAAAHPPEAIDWLARLWRNPLVAGLAGVAHVAGLHRCGTALSWSSSLSLADLDDGPGDRDSGAALGQRATPDDDGFGFFVAITPTTGTPAADDAAPADDGWHEEAAYS